MKRHPLHYEPNEQHRSRPLSWVSIVTIATLGIVPLLLGSRWLQLFIFTDYRAHHRPLMIPLGIIAAGIGGEKGVGSRSSGVE